LFESEGRGLMPRNLSGTAGNLARLKVIISLRRAFVIFSVSKVEEFFMKTATGLEFKIREMAQRIKTLREIIGLSQQEMATKTGVSLEEYSSCEAGESDLNFAFLYKCAIALNVDVTDIIEGTSPRLAGYTVTRAGEGQEIQKAHGMTYYNLAPTFKNRIAEPLYVVFHYDENAQNKEIELTTHEGQECDIVVKGALKVQVGDHVEILHEGDSIYYDSSMPHGMIAVENSDCIFYAFVLNSNDNAAKLVHGGARDVIFAPSKKQEKQQKRIWEDYIVPVENENGVLKSISFKNEEKFNFAFDVIDKLGRQHPEKTAIMHIAEDKTEKRITFGELKRASSQTANYFKSLGITTFPFTSLFIYSR